MAVRLPRPWYSQEERDADRFENGRQGAFARGMRQAAARDGVARKNWRPVPVPAPRQVRRQERQLQQRSDPARDTGRAQALARATQQQARGRTR